MPATMSVRACSLAVGLVLALGLYGGALPAQAQDAHQDGNFMLVLAQDRSNESQWMMVSVNLVTAQTKTILNAVRHSLPNTGNNKQLCVFALINSSTVVFYDYDSKNFQVLLETWSLRTGKRLSRFNIWISVLETMDYNTASKQLEGVCQLMVPGQNFTEPHWCGLNGSQVHSIYPLRTNELEQEARDDCVSYLDQATGIFWSPASWYTQKNIVYLGLVTGPPKDTSYDWKWFGAINGTPAFDAYAHDDVTNRSFAIQVAPSNSTSQLVEVIHGVDPTNMDHNPPPKVLMVFPDNLVLSKAGLAVYDSGSHQMHAIMEQRMTSSNDRADIVDEVIGGVDNGQQRLVSIDVVLLRIVSMKDIQWPESEGGLRLASMRRWTGL